MLGQDIKRLQKASARDLRHFGLMVGGVLLGLGIFFYLRHKTWWPWFTGPGALLVMLGAFQPRTLRWIYMGWMTLAMLLGAVVSTVLLTLLFYLMVTPLGLLARLKGKDFLRRKLDPATPSYWLLRDPLKVKAKHEHERQF